MTDPEIRERMNRPDYKFMRLQSQDIDMPRLVADARARQPGLIVVDRAVPGPYQNYLTPEARVPEQAILHPWEVPMPMATSWSYVPNDRYKSTRELVHMLADVVAKGGNLLLNIGPGPDGTWHAEAYERLSGLGNWLTINGEAIYGSRPMAPYAEGRLRFTRGKDESVYLIYLATDTETAIPHTLASTQYQPAEGAAITLLGSDVTLEWMLNGAGFVVEIPEAAAMDARADYAWVLKISSGRRTGTAADGVGPSPHARPRP